MKVLGSHEEWLRARTKIGGSDASAIVGMNPYKTNVDLFKEKAYGIEPEDISDNMIEFANDGLTVLSETLNHMVDDNTFYNYVLTVKNNSTEAITISESGMISKVNSFDINETFLWARDTFEPVTLEPGETRPFSMTIGLE